MNQTSVLRSHRHAANVFATRIAATAFIRIGTRFSSSSSLQLNDKKPILELLQCVADGTVSPHAAADRCDLVSEYMTVGNYAKVDTSREARTGFPEVVYGESKTPAQVAAIMKAMLNEGKDNVMASRVTSQAAEAICTLISGPELTYYEVPRILASKALQKRNKNGDNEKVKTACVLCAGTSDLPVAEEAAITLELADYHVSRLYDVGVAGIHRLLSNQHILRAADVAICVAGMDGALPGIVGGLTSSPVIAVPTSVGYGAAFGGLAPLLTMLNACSPGVGVVNIDNGFGAAVLAARILQRFKN